MHVELAFCHSRGESGGDSKDDQQNYNGEPAENGNIATQEHSTEDEDFEFYPFDSLETHYSDSEDEQVLPLASAASNRVLHYEQVSIDENYPGLMDCLRAGAPYCCVIPSCNGRPYPTLTSMRRHFTTHDPDMYAILICPFCKYVRSDDHPGDMKKHIMNKHGKDEAWAKDNMIVDISEKLQDFRRKTAKDSPQKRTSFNTFSNSLSKVPVSLEDPNIKASFTVEGGSDHFYTCGVPDCRRNFKSVQSLKQHYAKHDHTLRKNSYETCFR